MKNELKLCKWLNFVVFLFAVPSLIAQEVDNSNSSIRPLLRTTDSVFVEVDDQQQLIVYHTVEKGHTLFSLAKFYSVSYSDLRIYNEDVSGSDIKLGQVLKIPIPSKRIHIREGIPPADTSFIPVVYKVKQGETLFRISRIYFRMPTELLRKNNLRQNDELKPGEILTVGWFNLYGEEIPEFKENPEVPSHDPRKKLRTVFSELSKTKEEIKDSGVAFWNDEEKFQYSRNHFVLHHEAPENSVMRIFNPMTNRVIYAKVVGRIPANTYDDSIVLILTPSSANALGAIDPRFHVKIQYLK